MTQPGTVPLGSTRASAHVSEQDILQYGARQIADPTLGARVVDDDGVEQAFADAGLSLERQYTTATVLHFQLEPVNATAQEIDGVWHIHAGTQWQSLTLPVLAKALQVPESQVVLHTYLLGGGFGRRLNGDYCIPAALGAKALAVACVAASR